MAVADPTMAELRRRRLSARRGAGVTVPEPATLLGDVSGKAYAKVGDRPDGKPESFIVPSQPANTQTLAAPTSGGGPPDLAEWEQFAQDQFGEFTSDRDRLGKMWRAWAGTKRYGSGGGSQPQWDWLQSQGLNSDIVKEYNRKNLQYKDAPVSMATGGFGVAGGIGGGNTNPDDAQLREILNLRRQRLAASQDLGNLADVGLKQTLQASEDQRYGMLDVPTPANVNTGMGQGGGFASPLVRPSIRTNAEMLGEQINNRQEELSINQAERSLNESQYGTLAVPRTAGGYGGSNGRQVSSGSPRAPSSGGGRTNTLNGPDYGYQGQQDEYLTDPTTGQSILVRREDVAATRKKLAEKAAKERGMVLYDDPENPNGIGIEVTPAEAAVRKARDAAKVKAKLAAAAQPRSPYAALPETTLVSYAVDGSLKLPDLVDELVQRVDPKTGEHLFSPKAIGAIVDHVKSEIKKAADKEGGGYDTDTLLWMAANPELSKTDADVKKNYPGRGKWDPRTNKPTGANTSTLSVPDLAGFGF